MTHPSNHTFAVIEDHPAMAVCRCAMCGGEVDQHGDATAPAQGRSTEAAEAAAAVIRRLTHIAQLDPRVVGLLLIKADQPGLSVRELADRYRIKKSAMAELVAKVESTLPGFIAVIHGTHRMATIAQKRRRKRERSVD